MHRWPSGISQNSNHLGSHDALGEASMPKQKPALHGAMRSRAERLVLQTRDKKSGYFLASSIDAVARQSPEMLMAH